MKNKALIKFAAISIVFIVGFIVIAEYGIAAFKKPSSTDKKN